MAPKDPKINKHTVAVTTRNKILTSLETLEIVRKPASATRQNIITAAHKIGC